MRANRAPKSAKRNLDDLASHLFLMREHLHKLPEDKSHLKVIAAELRTLACCSSGTEGLLWRLVDEFEVDDGVLVHAPRNLNPDHPLARDLEFAIVPIARGGQGDPRLPACVYSLKGIIKQFQALIAEGAPLTHEDLIKKVAQQMGTAHEDEGWNLRSQAWSAF